MTRQVTLKSPFKSMIKYSGQRDKQRQRVTWKNIDRQKMKKTRKKTIFNTYKHRQKSSQYTHKEAKNSHARPDTSV